MVVSIVSTLGLKRNKTRKKERASKCYEREKMETEPRMKGCWKMLGSKAPYDKNDCRDAS